MSHCLCPLKEAALATPHAPALQSKERTFSFQELDYLTESMVEKLHHCQITDGDRVAILHPPCPEWIALFFAILRLGASPCPLSLRLPAAQIQTALERLQPQLFIDSFPFKAQQRSKKKPFFRSIFLFTSGSTGQPKIAVLPFQNLLVNASFSLPLTPSDRWLLSLPLYHVGGIGIVLRCLLAKASLSLDERDPAITHLSYVPTQLYRANPVYKNLKAILLGGAPIRAIPDHLPIYATYGLTEMGSSVLLKESPQKIDGKYYLGLPLPKRELRLQSDGEIFVKGETLFQGYFENETLYTPLESGWFATNDIGAFDPQEGFAIVGRKDWQFISGGENIQPEEIESYLLQIPSILEAVVIPKKDPEFGMRPMAWVKTTENSLSETTIRAFLSNYLPKYKIPTQIHFVDEIPKQGLKIDRRKIIDATT